MSRLNKAWRLVQNQRVTIDGDDNLCTYFSVTSDSTNKKRYTVEYVKKTGVWMCECPDYAYRSAQLVIDDDGERIGSFLCGHIIASIMRTGELKKSGQVEFV
jgi:hypothetical protein